MMCQRHSVNGSRRSSRPNHCLTIYMRVPRTWLKCRICLHPYITADRQWMGPAYRFSRLYWGFPPRSFGLIGVKHIYLNLVFSDLISELDHCQPVVAIVEGDRAVSICQSVRKSVEAEEAGVDTLLSHRGKGYAAQVVAGWAGIVREQGRMPLY